MIFKEREPLIDAQALTKPVILEQTLEQKETKTNEEFIAGQSQLIKENKENIEETKQKPDFMPESPSVFLKNQSQLKKRVKV